MRRNHTKRHKNYKNRTRRKQAGGSKSIKLDADLTMRIVDMTAADAITISMLSKFFRTTCWKGNSNNETWFDVDTMLDVKSNINGNYVYVTNNQRKIVFAQIVLTHDTRNNVGGELYMVIKGSCTDETMRGHGIFKKVLHKLAEYYKPRRVEAIVLSADIHERNGINARARHLIFAKSGMTIPEWNGIDKVHVKLDDGDMYQVEDPRFSDVKPDLYEIVVSDEDNVHKKIPISSIVSCYKFNHSANELELIECPFMLVLN